MLDFLFDCLCCCGDYEMSPEEIGKQGEKIVIKKSKPRLWEYQRELHDYTFRSKDGKSRQIDHIIIRSNGIFVVETKNYSGTIYGTENQMQWTQVLGYGREKHKFYNPVKQNATHVSKIREILGKDAPIFSIVVFVNGNIEFIDIDNVYDTDGYRERVFKTFDYYLDTEEIEEYYEMLIEAEEDIDPEEHIEEVKEAKQRNR